MDDSRKQDLETIEKKLKDPATTRHQRRSLENARAAIARQQKDQKAMSLRHQLVNASRAGDSREVYKLSQQLQALDHEQGYDRREV